MFLLEPNCLTGQMCAVLQGPSGACYNDLPCSNLYDSYCEYGNLTFIYLNSFFKLSFI